jgi:hypothetical protein
VASLIQRVAPHQGAVLSDASISSDPASSLRVKGDGVSLAVTLPKASSLSAGTRTGDGTVVYRAVNGPSTAVQALSSGAVRVQSVIGSASEGKTFSYSFGDGFRPVKATDGYFYVVGFDPTGKFTAFSVAAAWARDANGNDVATNYVIQGDNLVQVVSPSPTAAYPIVADPTWQWYSAAYGAGFSKKETRTLASAGAVSGFCGLLPGPFAIACGVLGADWWTQAGLAAEANECVFIAVVPAPIAMRWITSACK